MEKYRSRLLEKEFEFERLSLVTRNAVYISCSSGSGAIFLRIENKKANKVAPVSTRFGEA
jgi:hypothetical protein